MVKKFLLILQVAAECVTNKPVEWVRVSFAEGKFFLSEVIALGYHPQEDPPALKGS